MASASGTCSMTRWLRRLRLRGWLSRRIWWLRLRRWRLRRRWRRIRRQPVVPRQRVAAPEDRSEDRRRSTSTATTSVSVDSYDGAFQKLGVEGGGHKVELKADGYEPPVRGADHAGRDRHLQGRDEADPVSSRWSRSRVDYCDLYALFRRRNFRPLRLRRRGLSLVGRRHARVALRRPAGQPAYLLRPQRAVPDRRRRGYYFPWRDPARYRGYLWVMGPMLKGAGAAAFLLDYLFRGSPASFLLFAASDGTLALLTLWALLRQRQS